MAAVAVSLESRRYRDAALPVWERVADLLPQLTLEECIAQVSSRDGGMNADEIEKVYGSTGLGATTINVVTQGSLNATVIARNKLQAAMLKSRLGIPLSFYQEGLHSGSAFGTVFPMPLTTASSWNDSLPQLIGAAMAVQARATGVDNRASRWRACLNDSELPEHRIRCPLPHTRQTGPPSSTCGRTRALGAFKRDFHLTRQSRRTWASPSSSGCRAARAPRTTTSRATGRLLLRLRSTLQARVAGVPGTGSAAGSLDSPSPSILQATARRLAGSTAARTS